MSNLAFWLLCALAVAVIAALARLTRRFPAVGLIAGTAFIASAAYFWQRTPASSFHSDGSPAGAVMFVLFLAFECVLMLVGLGFLMSAVAAWRRGTAQATAPRTRARAMSATYATENPETDARPAADHGARASQGASTAAPVKRQATAAPRSIADEPMSLRSNLIGGAAVVAFLIGVLYAIAGARGLLGRSQGLLCGRKSCIDLFGLLAWVQTWGGSVALGLCYLAISLPFFALTWRAIRPQPATRAHWLDRYRDRQR